MTNEEKQAAKARKEELARARAKQMAKNKEKNGNIFKRMGKAIKRMGKAIAKWFREMRSELKKVVWPSKSQIRNNTAVALLVIVSFAVVVWGFDLLASGAVRLIISIGG